MHQDIHEYYQKHIVQKKRRSVLKRIVSVMACVVIFCTTYALIMPAITMEQESFCGYEEHTHTEKCYAATEKTVLTCSVEGLQIHTHTESCYTDGIVTCGQADYVVHAHTDGCYDPLDGTLICDLPERAAHIHNDACYVPGETQPAVLHVHTDECNTSQKGDLVCTLEEYEGHAHSDSCYEPSDVLLCSKPENHVHSDVCYELPLNCSIPTDPHVHGTGCYGRGNQTCSTPEGHVHGDSCRETVSICTSEAEDHTHTDSCYESRTVCPIPENHSHGDGCYESIVVCGKEAGEQHTHGDGCYGSTPELICPLDENHVHNSGCYEPHLICTTAEDPGHSHSDDCYNWETVIGCGLEEGEPEPTEPAEPVLVCTEPVAQTHVHGDDCFKTETTDAQPICGNAADDHEHTAECYELSCALEAHEHSLACFSDPDADVETRETWEATFGYLTLSGNWNEDVLAIAETQLGYTESTRNYAVWADNSIHGYTRYGAWYGVPYGDWCGMFVSFCLNYAGVKDMPLNYGVRPWIEDLTELGLYFDAEEYDPIPGDIVFFDWEDDGLSDHVGIVAEMIEANGAEPAKLKTIEGNSSNRVQYVYYELNDPVLLGYSKLPEKPEEEDEVPVYSCGLEEHQHTETCYDEAGELVCELTDHTHSAECETASVTYYCGLEEHVHAESCYGEGETLICLLEEHEHTDACTQEPKPVYLCGLMVHKHGDACLDENGELICTEAEHEHTEECLNPAEPFYCGIGAHSHTQQCYDAENVLICTLEEHVHATECTVDLSMLDEDVREHVIRVIQRIDGIPSADEIDAKIEEFETAEDYEGEEAWMTELYQEIAKVYLDYSKLSEEHQAYVINRDKLLELEYIWSVAVLAPATIWLDGSNGGMTNLYGSPDTAYSVFTGDFFELPETWDSPTKQDFKLRGWYLISEVNNVDNPNSDLSPNDCYYLPGAEVEVTGDMVFYADWVAEHYNFGQDNNHVVPTADTDDFITTHMFDYSSIFNMYSSRYDGSVNGTSHSETWTARDLDETLPNGDRSYGFILRDWDSKNDVLSKPENFNSDSYPQFNYQTTTTRGLLNNNPNPLTLLFTPGNTYFRSDGSVNPNGVLGTQYLGTGNHLFQYDNNPDSQYYGYYFYDSLRNAASYNQSQSRFYVYDYIERTNSDEDEGGHDFLPFNSPYVNNPQNSNGTYIYDHLTSMSDSYSGTNYWFGMVNQIRFYLPNQSNPSGNANLSMQGDQMIFSFSGDDDVWVFVDNQLILDIGGIHKARSGTINFSTGQVQLETNETSGYDITTTYTFEPGEHTLTMYYMERGSTLSNCSVYFNISPRFDLKLEKVDPNREALLGAKFEVFEGQENANGGLTLTPVQLWPTYNDYVADRNNEVKQYTTNIMEVQSVINNGIQKAVASIWGFSPGHVYYIKETVPPDEDGYILPNGLIRLELDTSGSVSDIAVVVKDTNLDPGLANNPSPGYEVISSDLNESTNTITVVVQNSYPAKDIRVKKVWAGENVTTQPVIVKLKETYNRPLEDGTFEEVTAYVGDPVVLSDDNNWEHIWEYLPLVHTIRTVTPDGSVIIQTMDVTYSVEEDKIDGFKTTIEFVPKGTASTAVTVTDVTSFTNNSVYLLRNQNNQLLAANSDGLYWTTDDTDVGAHWTASNVSNQDLTLRNGHNLYLRANTDSRIFYVSNEQGNITFRNSSIVMSVYQMMRPQTYYLTGIQNGQGTTNTSGGLAFSRIERAVVETTTTEDLFTITNTADPSTFVEVKKEWVNWDGTPADPSLYEDMEVTVNLLADDAVLTDKTAVLNKDNEWTYTWLDLPRDNASGVPIRYTVDEDLQSEDLQSEDWTCVDISQNEEGVWVITNQRKLNIPVQKFWQAITKPDSIDVQLYAVYNDSETATLIDTITLTGEEWTGTFEDVGQKLKDKQLEPTGVTFYVHEPTEDYTVEYDPSAKIFIPTTGDEPKQVTAGQVIIDPETGNANTVTITNYEMIELPRTGGVGTILYTAGGLLLMAAALFLLFYNRKSQISRP